MLIYVSDHKFCGKETFFFTKPVYIGHIQQYPPMLSYKFYSNIVLKYIFFLRYS